MDEYFKIKSNSDTEKMKVFDIVETIQKSLKFLKIKAAAEQTTLEFTPPTPILVRSKETRLHLAFHNIVINALKFAKGGSVKISLIPL